MEVKTRRFSGKTIAAILAGILAGTVLISPAGAHFKKKIGHLTNHMKSTFFTKGQTWSRGQADGRYAGICFPVDGALLGSAYIEDADVAGAFGTGGILQNQCAPMEIRTSGTGEYEIAVADGFLSFDDCPGDVPIAQVTSVGTDTQASYEPGADADDRTVILVHRTAGDGSTAQDGDFVITVNDWIINDGACVLSASQARPGTPSKRVIPG